MGPGVLSKSKPCICFFFFFYLCPTFNSLACPSTQNKCKNLFTSHVCWTASLDCKPGPQPQFMIFVFILTPPNLFSTENPDWTLKDINQIMSFPSLQVLVSMVTKVLHSLTLVYFFSDIFPNSHSLQWSQLLSYFGRDQGLSGLLWSPFPGDSHDCFHFSFQFLEMTYSLKSLM